MPRLLLAAIFNPITAVVAVLVLVVGLIWWDVADDGRWQAQCRRDGGRITSHTSVAPVISGKGGVTVVTTEYCLNAGGGIISMR